MRKLLVLVVLLSLPAFAQEKPKAKKEMKAAKSAGAATIPTAAKAAVDSVKEKHIRQHVRFLSHDLLEGRGTGQRGGDIAAEYMATQFALYGLKPAGDNGTYMQKVPLVGLTTQPQSTFTLAPAKSPAMKLTFKDDYVAYNETLSDKVELNDEIIWAGYGIDAPEYKWNDFKDVDVRGKVLLMLVSEPTTADEKFFKGRALTYYGRWTYKYEQAARKGAAAVILIHKTDMASYGWDVVRNSNSGERAYLRTNTPKLKSAGWIQLEVARKLAAASGMDLEQMMKDAQSPDFRPKPLGARLQATLISKARPMESNNVLAMLPGSDPKLKDEVVVYSAHYDHLGIRADVQGDNIYNGANDNATGCAMILEMAHAFAHSKEKPRRSILFAAVTAEEQGLRGSEYLGQNPPVPAGKITVNLNFDDIAPLGEPEEVITMGSERSDFYSTVEATAKSFGMAIKPDLRPERGSYYRSDHFSMARVGVPAFSIKEGDKFVGHPAEWGQQKAEEYNSKDYHQPSDEYKADMDFRANVKIAQFGIALGWKAANQEKLIGWVPGDEFEAARKASLK
ncbi:MAG TPA: M28 family peptidase [Terriglobales bacterium]|nr:M28 family peptidase [Terriglobales bacterium]